MLTSYSLTGLSFVNGGILIHTESNNYLFDYHKIKKLPAQKKEKNISKFFEDLVELLKNAIDYKFEISLKESSVVVAGEFKFYDDLEIAIVREDGYLVVFDKMGEKLEIKVVRNWVGDNAHYIVRVSCNKFLFKGDFATMEFQSYNVFTMFYSTLLYNYLINRGKGYEIFINRNDNRIDFVIADVREVLQVSITKNGIEKIKRRKSNPFRIPAKWVEFKDIISQLINWGWEFKLNNHSIVLVKEVKNYTRDQIEIYTDRRGDWAFDVFLITFISYNAFKGIYRFLGIYFHDGYIIVQKKPNETKKVVHMKPGDKEELDELWRWVLKAIVSLSI